MTSEEFLAELEALDVGVVKQRIASGVYLRPWKELAQGWVEHKEAIASAEQMALAHRARRDAPWANWIALWGARYCGDLVDCSGGQIVQSNLIRLPQ
jgi:hypothetical protein